MEQPPEATQEETLRRSQQVADTAARAVALQLRRLATNEPEDVEFWDRMWADWEYLIVSLRRLERAARAVWLATSDEAVNIELTRFHQRLPSLKHFRDIGEHWDDYVLNNPKRHVRHFTAWDLDMKVVSPSLIGWLGHTLEAADVRVAAADLFQVVMAVRA